MSKNYIQLLPVSDKIKVMDQFGRLPLSIMEFKNTSKWDCAYFDQDKSEQRRSEEAEYLPGLGMSEFASEVADFVLKYWSMKHSIVVDPFAGRATRAVISTKLNRQYYGYEISKLTYDRSIEHFKKLNILPHLFLEDGCLMKQTPDDFAHLIFSCPPYYNLEKYEEVDSQLSSLKTYDDFLKRIVVCAENIKRVMKPGAFCCWVCADWRDSNGFRQFSNDSINIFKSVGLIPHDDVIIKNNSPFASLMCYKVACKRITAKTHERLLVFRKEGQLDLTGLEKDDFNETSSGFIDF